MQKIIFHKTAWHVFLKGLLGLIGVIWVSFPGNGFAIDLLTQTQIRSVTAAKGFVVADDVFLKEKRNPKTGTAPESPEISGQAVVNGSFAEDETYLLFPGLVFPLKSINIIDIIDTSRLLAEPLIFVGECGLLTSTYGPGIMGVEHNLAFSETVIPAETIDVQVNVPKAANAGKSYMMINREAGLMQVLGGVLEIGKRNKR